MRTLICAGHARQVVAHHITAAEAAAVCNVLRSVEGIQVSADVGYDGTLNLRPSCPVSTGQEVAVLRAFTAVTDSPLHWHPAVAA